MSVKAKFMTTLQVRRTANGMWELTSALIYVSEILPQVVVVPAGFKTDFASVPRLPVAYLLFGNAADEAAVVHDFLYSNNTNGVTRKQADDVFAEASRVLGIPAWRRGPMWLGVRLFGGAHWGDSSPFVAPIASDMADLRD